MEQEVKDGLPNWCSCYQLVGQLPVICEPHRLIAAAKVGLVNELEREVIRLNKELAAWKDNFYMYRGAWLREIGGYIRRKSHEIDGFVLRTRDALKEAEERGKAATQYRLKAIGVCLDALNESNIGLIIASVRHQLELMAKK